MDYILHHGDSMYQSVPHKYDYFDYTELPLHVSVDNWFANNAFGDHVSGFIHTEHSTGSAVSFPAALTQSASVYSGCLLTINDTTVAIIHRGSSFLLFDSHSRDSHGFVSSNGTAVLLEFTSAEHLHQHLKHLYMIPQTAASCLMRFGANHDSRCQFDIVPVLTVVQMCPTVSSQQPTGEHRGQCTLKDQGPLNSADTFANVEQSSTKSAEVRDAHGDIAKDTNVGRQEKDFNDSIETVETTATKLSAYKLEQKRSRDRERKRRKRQDAEMRQMERLADKLAKRVAREDVTIRMKKQAADRLAKRAVRTDPAVRATKQASGRDAKRAVRTDPAARAAEQSANTAAKRAVRTDPAARAAEQSANTAAKRAVRTDPAVRATKQVSDRAAKRAVRTDPAARAAEQSANTAAKRAVRTDPRVRATKRKEDRRAKRKNARTSGCPKRLDGDISESVAQLRATFARGPVYTCACCNRRLYKHSVYSLNIAKYQRTPQCAANAKKCLSHVDLSRTSWICGTCHQRLLRGSIPAQALCNKMHLPTIPLALADLTDLEARLVARRILFMKIFRLPRGAHQGIKGSVVNVPADVTKIASVLPRIPSQCALIALKLKRDLRYKSAVSQQTIRPHRVLEALEYLILNNPEHYGDISLNNSWVEHSAEDDSELWNALVADDSEQLVAENSDPSPAHSIESENNSEHNSSTENSDSDSEDEETTPTLDSCLQPAEGPVQSTTDIISVAPGEGQTPLSLFTDDNSELLAFPKLFPAGSFGHSAQHPVRLTLRKYFNARMLSADTRFAVSLEYLFNAQYMSDAKQITQPKQTKIWRFHQY